MERNDYRLTCCDRIIDIDRGIIAPINSCIYKAILHPFWNARAKSEGGKFQRLRMASEINWLP